MCDRRGYWSDEGFHATRAANRSGADVPRKVLCRLDNLVDGNGRVG
jgi:hypothetical protein